VQDASGRPLSLGGRAFLRVLFTPASAHTDSGRPTYSGPLPTQFDLPVLRSVKPAGDFEDVLSFGVGLWEKTALHVFTLAAPSRLVVDITVPAGGPGRLGEVDNGRLVYLHAGQRTTVALKTCVDCGYSWHIATAPDRQVVGTVTATVVPLPHYSGVVGFPFESRWVLRAAGPGSTVLRLVELPPQRGAAPVARYSLRFTVTA
jgi:predicted secreted protein